MTEVKIASRTCPDEFGRPRTFHYALTVDTVESDTFSCENYGVRISEESGDTAAIPGITTSAVRIDELLTLLVEASAPQHCQTSSQTGYNKGKGSAPDPNGPARFPFYISVQHTHCARHTHFLRLSIFCIRQTSRAIMPSTTKIPSIPWPIISRAAIILSKFIVETS